MNTVSNQVEYGWAEPADLEEINRFYSLCGYSGKIQSEDFAVVAKSSGQIIGAVRLESKIGHLTLRGFYVHPEFQGQGIGSHLLKVLENKMNAQEVFCLADSKSVSLLEKLNFESIDSESLPQNLQARAATYLGQGFQITTMKRQSVSRPSYEVLEDCLKKWGLRGNPIFIRNNENCVYELDEKEIILRFTEPSHRNYDELQGELLWIEALCAEGSTNFGRPLKNLEGSYISSFKDGERVYFASLFKKAKGSSLADEADYSPETYHQLGQIMGRMHRFEKNNSQNFSRRDWSADKGFALAKKSARPEDGRPHQIFQQALAWLETLPKDRSGFGLIHSDIHQGNFFVDEAGAITLFDFDDGQRHWFAYDLAVTIFSIQSAGLKGTNSSEIYQHCREAILAGYLSEYALDKFWIERLPLFRAFRNILLFYWGKSRIENSLAEPSVQHKITQMMDGCLQRLESFKGFPKGDT